MKTEMKKVTTIGVACLLAATMIGSATFAWFTAKDSVNNYLETAQIADGSVKIVEIFTPPTDWSPGQTVTKDVKVSNNGNADVLVRVSFEEVLNMLSKPVALDTSIDDAANAGKIAQYLNVGSYSGWADASSTFTVDGTGTGNAGFKVKMTSVTVDGKTSYSFVPWYEIQNGVNKGKIQRVTADFKIDGQKLTVSNIKYWASDKKETTAAWANFGADSKTGAAYAKVGRSDIVYAASDANHKILLKYLDTTLSSRTTADSGKWFYNEDDGFFYYIGKLAPGAATASLLSSLTLDKDAGPEYAGMNFNLIVNLQAIQNTSEAVKASTGWGLSDTSAVFTALKPFMTA
jgi:predicted ribosomally synthesized peptide with SipW-like signal peptide